MPPTSINLPDRGVLQTQIQALDLRRAQLASQLNELQSTTSALSPDILLKIFGFLRPTNRLATSQSQPSKDIRLISQVCKSWRTHALSSATLWSNLNCNQESAFWLSELLKRSDNAPIHVSAGFHPRNQQEFVLKKLQDVLANCKVVGSISLSYNPWQLDRQTREGVYDVLASESLMPTTRVSLRLYPNSFSQNQSMLKIMLPRLGVQNLHQLETTGYHVDLSLPCFNRLGVLSVSFLSNPPTSQEWIRALAQVPGVVHLRLENAMRASTSLSTPADNASNLHLKQLKTLALIGILENGIDQFLRDIRATRGYSLLLRCNMGHFADPALFLLGLRKWFEVWGNQQPEVARRRVSVMASSQRFWIHNQIPDRDQSNEWFRIYLNWGYYSLPHERGLELMASISQILRPVISQARTLSISLDQSNKPCCFSCQSLCPLGFWDNFSSVEILRFVNESVPSPGSSPAAGFLINCLCTDSERSFGDARPLPLLSTLSFEKESLMVATDVPFTRSESMHFSWKNLERLLKCRSSIRTIELYSCQIDDHVLSRLALLRPVVLAEFNSPRY